MTKKKPAGLHKDAGKSQVESISPRALLLLGDVLTYGCRKYAKFNWTAGINVTQIYASTLRHLLKWYNGEDLDDESSLPHLAHALCDAMFLLEYMDNPRYAEFDDRPFKRRQHDPQ